MRYVLLLMLALPAVAQPVNVGCEPSPDTLRLLESVPPIRDTAIPYEQRVGALRALAQKYPADFFIQRAYQDSFWQDRALGEEFDRALAMYRTHPGEPLARYYEARLVMVSEPVRAKAVFAELLQANREFIWPHLDLTEFARFPGMRAMGDIDEHTAAFAKACSVTFVNSRAVPSRATLERRNSPLDATFLPLLWTSEEKSGIAPEVRADRIRADLKRVESWPFRADPDLYWLYKEAARILKEPATLDAFRAKLNREAPNSTLALSFVDDDWSKANPPPERNAPPSARKQYQDRRSQAQREWLKRWPNAWSLLGRVVMEIGARLEMGEGKVAPDELEILDQALRVRALSPDGGQMYPPLETAVARVYVSGKVRLDRVPALLDAALRNIERVTKYAVSKDLFPAEMRSQATDWPTVTAQRCEEIRVDYLIATNRPADARPLIEQALARFADAKPTPDASYRRSGWLRRLAQVDPDAAKTYEQAPVPAGPAPAPQFTQPLPEFSAADLNGRTWQIRDLKGKATFVNFWATWCGPCRGEHPGIQELYDRVKQRTDVQVLTFSVDDDAATARQYIKEKGYTFPVICSKELADRLFPYVGLPTNFLVNPEGVRTGMRGFSPDSANVSRVIEELSKAAARPAAR